MSETMTTPEALNELADRVEREEPSRTLDVAIARAVEPDQPRSKYDPNLLRYSVSLDAAVTLVPEWLHWEVGFVHIGEHPTTPLASAKIVGGLTHVNCEASSPAAALTAAALRARA